VLVDGRRGRLGYDIGADGEVWVVMSVPQGLSFFFFAWFFTTRWTRVPFSILSWVSPFPEIGMFPSL